MSKPIILLHTATVADIAQAITEVQSRSRVGLCKVPIQLAARVHSQVFLAERLALVDSKELREFDASAMWWEGVHIGHGDMTLVRLRTPFHEGQNCLLEVYRGKPWTTMNNGHLQLILKEG